MAAADGERIARYRRDQFRSPKDGLRWDLRHASPPSHAMTRPPPRRRDAARLASMAMTAFIERLMVTSVQPTLPENKKDGLQLHGTWEAVMTGTARSYFHRTSTLPLLNNTLGGALDSAAERWPDHEAVVVRDQDVRLTFAALRHEVDRVAAGLIALGLKPGDRVGLWSPNRIEWVLTQYATAKAGPDPGEPQPRLSRGGTGICAEQGRVPGADHLRPVQDDGLHRRSCANSRRNWTIAHLAAYRPRACHI